MIALGIDPGLSGGLALIAGPPLNQPKILDCISVPTDEDGVDVLRVIAFIKQHPPDRAFIERVSAMPSLPDAQGVRRGMGVTSAFNFGGAAWALRTCVIGLLGTKPTMVEPRAWKKVFGLSSRDQTGAKLEQREVKELSRRMALARFADGQRYFPNIGHHNRAEAALIALYGTMIQ